MEKSVKCQNCVYWKRKSGQKGACYSGACYLVRHGGVLITTDAEDHCERYKAILEDQNEPSGIDG